MCNTTLIIVVCTKQMCCRYLCIYTKVIGIGDIYLFFKRGLMIFWEDAEGPNFHVNELHIKFSTILIYSFTKALENHSSL